MPASLAIHRLSARTPARAQPVAARLALQSLGANLEDALPRGLPPQALLWLRRLRLQAPEAALLRPAPVAWRQDWIAAGRTQMDAALAQAARPALGPVPESAPAVLFADAAEMLACLALAAQAGQLERWWWRGLLGRAWPRAEAAWAARPEAQAAAVRLLVRMGQGGAVLAWGEAPWLALAPSAAEPVAAGQLGAVRSPARRPADVAAVPSMEPRGGNARASSVPVVDEVGHDTPTASPGTVSRPTQAVNSPKGHSASIVTRTASTEAGRAESSPAPRGWPSSPTRASGDERKWGRPPNTDLAPRLPVRPEARSLPADGLVPFRTDPASRTPTNDAAAQVAGSASPLPEPQPAQAATRRASPAAPAGPPEPEGRVAARGVAAPAEDSGSAQLREPATARRPAVPGTFEPAEEAPAAWPWPQALLSRQAPLLFLANALLEDGLYPDFTRPRDPGLPVPLWTLLAELARAWRLPDDPLQAALRERSPDWRVPDAMPAAPGTLAGPWPDWLAAYARSLRRRL
jgi:hypothetical protein